MGILKQGFALAAAAASALALAACGNGDQRLCTEANWYQTGVYHAQQGYENRLEKLQGICAEIGITPNASEYSRGYMAGPSMPRLQL